MTALLYRLAARALVPSSLSLRSADCPDAPARRCRSVSSLHLLHRMDRKSRRVSRFDLFLASALAGSGGLPPAEEELARLSKAYKFFDEFPVIGSLRTSKAHPVASEAAPFWLGFGGPAEDWCVKARSNAVH